MSTLTTTDFLYARSCGLWLLCRPGSPGDAATPVRMRDLTAIHGQPRAQDQRGVSDLGAGGRAWPQPR